MIKLAERSQWESLQALWQRCFGDGEAYNRFLFEHLLRPEHVLVHMGKRGAAVMDLEQGRVLERGQIPLAMLCFAPFALRSPMGEGPAAYVYGVATDPVARGQGLSTELMAHLHTYLTRKGYAASVLVPASESLFGFYGKRGYETAYQVCSVVVRAEAIPTNRRPCVLTPASLYRLQGLRDRLLGDNRTLYAGWDRDYLHYIGEECRFLGGEVLAVTGNGREGYAVCYPVEDQVFVKELALPQNRLEDVLAALHARYRASEYHLRLPEEFVREGVGEVLPFAMVRWYDMNQKDTLLRYPGKGMPKPPYITHVLD